MKTPDAVAVFGPKRAAEIEVAAKKNAPRIKQMDAVNVSAVWLGWRLIEVGDDRFALVKRFSEAERIPQSGGMTLEESKNVLDYLWREKNTTNGC